MWIFICEDGKRWRGLKGIMLLYGRYFLAHLDYFKGNKYVDMATGKDDLFQVINNL